MDVHHQTRPRESCAQLPHFPKSTACTGDPPPTSRPGEATIREPQSAKEEEKTCLEYAGSEKGSFPTDGSLWGVITVILTTTIMQQPPPFLLGQHCCLLWSNTTWQCSEVADQEGAQVGGLPPTCSLSPCPSQHQTMSRKRPPPGSRTLSASALVRCLRGDCGKAWPLTRLAGQSEPSR